VNRINLPRTTLTVGAKAVIVLAVIVLAAVYAWATDAGLGMGSIVIGLMVGAIMATVLERVY
jgi:hypothetical protein